MSLSKVTILLPVYNGAETLARAIHSIINQTYIDWQLLILEDGSNDTTLFVAQSFNDTRIKIVNDGLHLGIVARLNQGIQISQSQYIARMDADDMAYPNRLEKQIAFLEANPNIDLVGTAMRVLDDTGQVLGKRIFPTSHTPIVAQPWLKTISVAHPTWCGRTEWFREWPYREFLHNEDQELLLRAHTKSTYANLSDILVDYYETPSFSKKLITRWAWIKVLWSFYGQSGNVFSFLGGLVTIAIKIFWDLLKTIAYKINIFGSLKS
jgi:glycosyltransferase involved in cell wall biosynthesis